MFYLSAALGYKGVDSDIMEAPLEHRMMVKLYFHLSFLHSRERKVVLKFHGLTIGNYQKYKFTLMEVCLKS